MGDAAKVDSIDAIRAFRALLWKFHEAATVALGDAESDVHRTLMWVEGEQQQHWSTQIRKRADWVERCKEAVRMKKIFKDSTGRTASAIDEEKVLAKALKALEIAQQKLVVTKQHARKLVKEYQNYKGAVQRFATAVSGDIPRAAAHLDALTAVLDQYVALDTAPAGTGSSSSGGGAGMIRSTGDEVKPAPPAGYFVTDLSGFPDLNPPQVALLHAQSDSGLVTMEDGKLCPVTEEPSGDRFKIFDNVEAASEYGNKRIAADPKIECVIFSDAAQLLKVIRVKNESVV